MEREVLKKVGTLGGPIRVNPNTKRFYFGNAEPGGAFSKERLFGMHGPLLIGMPNPKSRHEELGLEAAVSDTKQDLIRELVYQGGMSRTQAERTVDEMLREGKLAEVNVEGLGKVLVWGGNPKR